MPTGLWRKGSSTTSSSLTNVATTSGQREYGRARVGERAYRQVSGQRGRNVTISLAVSPTNGLVYHTARIGGMNRQLFNDFFGRSRKTSQSRQPNPLGVWQRPCTLKRRLSQRKNRDKDADPLFAVPEYCRASHKCFKGCNKSRHFTPRHSSNNRWPRRSSTTRHSTWRVSTKNSLRNISKEYEYHYGCKVRRVVQIHADICTALS